MKHTIKRNQREREKRETREIWRIKENQIQPSPGKILIILNGVPLYYFEFEFVCVNDVVFFAQF